MNLRRGVMGLGLRALNRLAGLPGMDKPANRQRIAGWLHGASRAGFSTALAVNRPFKAARQLLKPSRPARAPASDLFDLTPTDEQAMIVDAVRRFADDALRPAATAADEACAIPPELLAQAAELGITAMNVPDELGGVGQERSVVTNALVAEALAHGDVGLAVACLSGPGVATALAEFGSAGQEARYLPSLTGDKPPQAAIAVMEGGALFNPFALKTRATRKGDGYVLEGEKQLVPCAMSAELFLVAASDDDNRPALFIVESGSAGLDARPQPAMGLRPAGLSRLGLTHVKLPAAARLGEDQPADYAQFIALSRLAWSALAVGATQAVLDYVIPYANEREAFGEPISHKQSVAFMIANIGIELEGMRLATWRAASLATRGQPFAREAALARGLCGRYGMRAGSDGVQVLGGHGFVKEHPVERWYRDLRAIAIMEGGVLL